jgi:glycosidase
MEEVKAAIEYRNRHLKSLNDQVQRFHGPHYKKDTYTVGEDYAPENTYYEYVSLMIPKLIFDNPRVQVNSRKPGPVNDVATALRYGLNRWVRDCVLR